MANPKVDRVLARLTKLAIVGLPAGRGLGCVGAPGSARNFPWLHAGPGQEPAMAATGSRLLSSDHRPWIYRMEEAPVGLHAGLKQPIER